MTASTDNGRESPYYADWLFGVRSIDRIYRLSAGAIVSALNALRSENEELRDENEWLAREVGELRFMNRTMHSVEHKLRGELEQARREVERLRGATAVSS